MDRTYQNISLIVVYYFNTLLFFNNLYFFNVLNI